MIWISQFGIKIQFIYRFLKIKCGICRQTFNSKLAVRLHTEVHKFPRGCKPKSDSEMGPKQLNRHANKIVDTFNNATKENDVFKSIAIFTLYTANFESINKMIKLRAQDDPLAQEYIIDFILICKICFNRISWWSAFMKLKMYILYMTTCLK